jgi:DNA-binding MurR/RpiR family transcriptional regulator
VPTVADTILRRLDGLTPSETRVGRAILCSYPGLGLRSATSIAAAAGASPATVLRFVTKLGFGGLPEFHDALRGEIDSRLRSPFELVERPAGTSALLESVIASEVRNVRETLERVTEETLRAVREALASASTVLLLGGRFSQPLAHYFYVHLQMLRPGVLLLGAGPGPLPDQIAHAGRGTCLVVFDFRRYAAEATFAAEYVKGRRGRVVVVTDRYVSPASRFADNTLVASIEGPSLVDSYTAVMALIDVLVSDFVASDDATRGRIARVERARSALAEHASADGRA